MTVRGLFTLAIAALLVGAIRLREPWLVVIGMAVVGARSYLESRRWNREFAGFLPQVGIVLLWIFVTSLMIGITSEPGPLGATAIAIGFLGLTLLSCFALVRGAIERWKSRQSAAAYRAELQEKNREIEEFYNRTTHWVRRIVVVPGSDRLVTSDGAGDVLLWSTLGGANLIRKRATNANVGNMVLCPQNRLIALAWRDRIEVWSADDLETRSRFAIPDVSHWIGCLAPSPDEKFLAIDIDAQIHFADIQSGEVRPCGCGEEFITQMLFSPNGSLLVCGVTGQGGSGLLAYRVMPEGLDPTPEAFDSSGSIDDAGDKQLTMGFSPGGKKLAVFVPPYSGRSGPNSSGEVCLFDVSARSLDWRCVLDPELAGDFPHPDERNLSEHTEIEFTSDGRHVICGGNRGTIYVLDSRDGSLHHKVDVSVPHRIVTFAMDRQQHVLWTPNAELPQKVPLDVLIDPRFSR